MIDNLELLKPFITFNSDDDFLYLQILQRKKENELLNANSRVIKNYYITSLEKLESHYPEIKQLCRQFNARASLRLNTRSFESVAFQSLLAVTNTIMNKDFKSVRRTYDRCCGQFSNDKNKKWILDIDVKDLDLVERIKAAVKFCRPDEGLDKHYVLLPTKSGYHLITSPFDVQQFKDMSRIKGIEIHKDNPVNLYIP